MDWTPVPLKISPQSIMSDNYSSTFPTVVGKKKKKWAVIFKTVPVHKRSQIHIDQSDMFVEHNKLKHLYNLWFAMFSDKQIL